MVNAWQGELGSSIDTDAYRRDSFDAWLSWEYMQRGIAGESTEMEPAEIAELCGKTKGRTRDVIYNALKSTRRTQHV
tara:strand:- start:889 stop:1119 length:231 start_codon:yes stop_codon:yes gene_type:complete